MDELSRRKFLKQFTVLSVGVGVYVLNGCEESSPLYGVSPDYGVPPIGDEGDELGNLYVRNISRVDLVLVDENVRLKTIGFRTSIIRVNVPLTEDKEKELRIYLNGDVRGEIENLQESSILKRWIVKLPPEIKTNPNFIWAVNVSEIKDCGEIILTYQPESDIIVDVKFVHSERIFTTERILPENSLHLGMSFGEYTMEYIYWKEQAPKVGDWIELGRISTEIVNGEEVPIRATLDAGHNRIERIIPNWDG